MADRQLFCVIILSVLIAGSGCYLGYFNFVDEDHKYIGMHNWMRLCIFFAQHVMTLGMLIKLLFHDQGEGIIKWIFQLSLVIIITFIGGEIFVILNGGRIFVNQLFVYRYSTIYKKKEDMLQFQANEITLYYQIMTDFVMFFVVSAIAMIVVKCKSMEEEQKYEFMIDNLKSEDFVDEPNAQEKKTCAICLTDLQSQRVLKVPCDHIFHKQCLVNWLKRSTICPLCRTDIQQSLDPNSPLRSMGNSIPVLHQPQPIPELTFPNQLNNDIVVQSSRRDMTQRVHSNNEGELTERVVEQRSNANNNSRMSYNNQGTWLSNHHTIGREDNQLPPTLPVIDGDQIVQQTRNQQNNNPFTPRRRRPNSTRIFGQENTPRSIYLPSPVSQKRINFIFNSTRGPKSQPLINVQNEDGENKQQRNVPSLENITLKNTISYPNPNQKFVQMRNIKRQTQIDDERINQMVRDQINS